MGHEVSFPGTGKKALALQPVFIKMNAKRRAAQCCRPLCYSHRQVGSDSESRWNWCLPCQQSRVGRWPSFPSFLRCIADLRWVTRERALWFSTIKLRLLSSKSLNGGTPAHLDPSRQRSAPVRSSAGSPANVAACSGVVVTSSWRQTGIRHVFH